MLAVQALSVGLQRSGAAAGHAVLRCRAWSCPQHPHFPQIEDDEGEAGDADLREFEADLGTPEGMARAERLYAEAEGAMPETNPKDPVGDELNAPVTPKIEWGGDPEAAVRNAKQGVATEAWNSFEKTKVAEGIMPVLTAARSQAAAAGDTARVAEVDRLKLALDASKAATLRGITGSDFWRSSGPVERGLTAEEARDRFMTAYRFQPEVPRIGGMSQRQMEAFPAKPTYAQVKELLESLEVKR
jgi:hypothetical protein